MTQATKDKIRKTSEDNEKKIMDLCGYEIWRDPLNYTTVKNGKNLYFTTFKNALIDIRNEVIRTDIAGAKMLDNAIKVINEVDEAFMKALVEALEKLRDDFNGKRSYTKDMRF